ncbi:hypothetical protein Poli38472_004492 [Pythium oligandrum]|uniref:OTU domain-containing protein n=1 Tax=Pythium oligandrum TaxID=41045 RepID=A0A8K1CB44_PYTOL|nr:hypothetical protein Poli38472_004492 [Pythium oligandrum]|eukprot:TMW59423.1 hypothetical protein Poli38472_004492 [Pythium oligandrum]
MPAQLTDDGEPIMATANAELLLDYGKGKPVRKKGKKKSVVSDDSVQIMRKRLADVGCKLLEVEADGNCLFRALGDQLFGDQQQHVEIRKRIVDYIEVKRDDFEPFMEDEEKFEHYCKRMREDSTWGGNQEIYAVARLFRVYIVIHQESSRMVIECDRHQPKRVLHLAYHGSDHYDSVRALQDVDMSAPPVEIELDVDGFRPNDLAKRWKAYQTSESHRIAAASEIGDDVSEETLASQLKAMRVSSSSTSVLSKREQRLLKKQQRQQRKRSQVSGFLPIE